MEKRKVHDDDGNEIGFCCIGGGSVDLPDKPTFAEAVSAAHDNRDVEVILTGPGGGGGALNSSSARGTNGAGGGGFYGAALPEGMPSDCVRVGPGGAGAGAAGSKHGTGLGVGPGGASGTCGNTPKYPPGIHSIRQQADGSVAVEHDPGAIGETWPPPDLKALADAAVTDLMAKIGGGTVVVSFMDKDGNWRSGYAGNYISAIGLAARLGETLHQEMGARRNPRCEEEDDVPLPESDIANLNAAVRSMNSREGKDWGIHVDIFSQNGTWTNLPEIGYLGYLVTFYNRDNHKPLREQFGYPVLESTLPREVLGATENLRFENGMAYFGNWLRAKANTIEIKCQVPKR